MRECCQNKHREPQVDRERASAYLIDLVLTDQADDLEEGFDWTESEDSESETGPFDQ